MNKTGTFAHITAEKIVEGVCIVERNERGKITRRMAVAGTGPCKTGPGNIHVYPNNIPTVQCYARLSSVEIEL